LCLLQLVLIIDNWLYITICEELLNLSIPVSCKCEEDESCGYDHQEDKLEEFV